MSKLALTRKQMKAFLNVMAKDEARPALCRASVEIYDGEPVLVATNGYMLAALKLGDECSGAVGLCVMRKELIKWYKLAERKDIFTEEQLLEILEENDVEFPKWQKAIPPIESAEGVERLSFNGAYANTLEILNDCPLEFVMHGRVGALVAENSKAILVLMPLRA